MYRSRRSGGTGGGGESVAGLTKDKYLLQRKNVFVIIRVPFLDAMPTINQLSARADAK